MIKYCCDFRHLPAVDLERCQLVAPIPVRSSCANPSFFLIAQPSQGNFEPFLSAHCLPDATDDPPYIGRIMNGRCC